MSDTKVALRKDILGVKAKKINSEPGDGHQNGTKCTIIAESPDTPIGIVYLAIFEDFPLPVGIADFRVKLLTNEKRVKLQLNKAQLNYLELFPQGMFKFYHDEQGKEEQENDQNHKKNSEKT